VKRFIDTSQSFYVRLILLVGVLMTLCISEGVGLQLLPIPTVMNAPFYLGKATVIEVCADVPYSPPRHKSISGRVEIIAPKIDRLSQQQSIHPDTATLLTIIYSDVNLPCVIFSVEKPAFAHSSTFVSPSAGRAPPSLA
jgi:hypothetical protein